MGVENLKIVGKCLFSPKVRKSGSPEVRKSEVGSREVGKSGSPEVRMRHAFAVMSVPSYSHPIGSAFRRMDQCLTGRAGKRVENFAEVILKVLPNNIDN